MNAPHEISMRDAIQSARQQHRAGAGAVLDVLMRLPGIDRASLAHRLATEAGVGMLADDHHEVADFSVLDRQTARGWRCAVVSRDDAGPFLAAEDPWDDVLVQRVSRRLGV